MLWRKSLQNPPVKCVVRQEESKKVKAKRVRSTARQTVYCMSARGIFDSWGLKSSCKEKGWRWRETQKRGRETTENKTGIFPTQRHQTGLSLSRSLFSLVKLALTCTPNVGSPTMAW